VIGELTHHLAKGTRREGFITAIEMCGRILAEHFPPGHANKDELPNHLIVLNTYGRA
jgi:putative membrane protein